MQFLSYLKSFFIETNIVNTIFSLIFLSIIFYTTFIYFFEKIINKKITTLKKTLFILINSLFFLLSSIFIKSIFSQLIIILFNTIYLIFMMKESFVKYFLYSTIFSIIIFNIELFILKPILYFNLKNYNYLNLSIVPLFQILLFLCIIISIILTFFIIKNTKINCYQTIKSKSSYEKFIIYFIDYAIIFEFLNILFTYNDTNKLKILFIFSFVLNFFFLLSIRDIIKILKIEDNELKILSLELYNKSISEAYDSTRTFKHDFNNIIQAIGGYIINEDIKGLKTYYNQIFPEITNINNVSKLNPDIINNPAIYSILADKYFRAEKYQVSINLDVLMDLNNLNAKIYEITRILGILLDNAIETCKECDKKNINITFKQNDYKQIILIENTYHNKEICIEKIFDKGYSTKPNNTGLGLWEVKKIINKNSNFNLFTSKDNEYFMQQLEIYQ